MPADVWVVLALLGACLVAVLLVLLARREAAAQRSQAAVDVASIKDDARTSLQDARRREERVEERERSLDHREQKLSLLAETLDQRAEAVQEREKAADSALTAAHRAAQSELESIAGLSAEEASARLIAQITEQATRDAATAVRRAEASARATADERARRIVATAVQRVAGPTSAQSVVTIIQLPSEEMKGRIIGKEGRNIRTFEALTGVNLVVDDTPDAVMLSSFDAERREIAAVALEALLADGRIHPQRIEAAYSQAQAGAQDRAIAAGHEAAERAGVARLHPELIETLGRLRLRTSYGQNVLAHLVESAQIAGVIAAELGADVERARRAAFLHDIGKARPVGSPGTHALVGAEQARQLGEDGLVVNAIAAHHDEVPAESVEAVIVQAADGCSAARPGARREELDQYVERMESLESLVAARPGVRRVLAMAAGREVRVVVEPEEVSDEDMSELAQAIAKTIEADLSYPGEIKVTVIRELRASATAG